MKNRKEKEYNIFSSFLFFSNQHTINPNALLREPDSHLLQLLALLDKKPMDIHLSHYPTN